MRMGLHAMTSHHMDLVAHYYRTLRPPLFKTMVANAELIEAVKEASPYTKVIWRNYWADQPKDLSTYRHFREETMHELQPIRHLVDYVEGWNEFGVKDDPRLANRFVDHEIRWAKDLMNAGIGAAIGGFSTGHIDDNNEMFDALENMFEFCHVYGGKNPRVLFHSHEYAGPHMGFGFQTADGKNQWPRGGTYTGTTPVSDAHLFWDPDGEGWLTVRYRKLLRRLKRHGYTNMRFAFTETGVDDTPPRPGGPDKRGWRDYRGTEWERGPLGDYANQQRWYGWQLAHDPEVFGWTSFGWADNTHDWESFDLSRDMEMYHRMIEEQAKLPVGHHHDPDPDPDPDPGPDPDPDPGPGPVSPRPEVWPAVRVRQGDGYYSIARRIYGEENLQATAHRLMDANNGVQLRPGDVLYAPGYVVIRFSNADGVL